jgi:hypothetical protein
MAALINLMEDAAEEIRIWNEVTGPRELVNEVCTRVVGPPL